MVRIAAPTRQTVERGFPLLPLLLMRIVSLVLLVNNYYTHCVTTTQAHLITMNPTAKPRRGPPALRVRHISRAAATYFVHPPAQASSKPSKQPSTSDHQQHDSSSTPHPTAPKEQLKLSAEQLAQEVLRVLQAVDPYAPKSAVRFDSQHRAFRHEPSACHTLCVYTREGSLAPASDPASAPSQSPLRNSFNFCDRGMQTTTHPPRSRGTATQDVPRADAATAADAAAIHNAAAGNTAAAKGLALESAASLVERLVTHNSQRDILMDFKVVLLASLLIVELPHTGAQYYEDATPEGALLPLWDLRDILRGKAVTALAWSPCHPTLLAVAYGSQDFQRQVRGAVACWSLQQPSQPERLIKTACGTYTRMRLCHRLS